MAQKITGKKEALTPSARPGTSGTPGLKRSHRSSTKPSDARATADEVRKALGTSSSSAEDQYARDPLYDPRAEKESPDKSKESGGARAKTPAKRATSEQTPKNSKKLKTPVSTRTRRAQLAEEEAERVRRLQQEEDDLLAQHGKSLFGRSGMQHTPKKAD
jgi:ketosteroid isomerase-like protein